MPRDMFGDVVEPSIKVGSKKWYTVPLSILIHVLVIGSIIIIPLMATDVLPTPSRSHGGIRGGPTAAASPTTASAPAGGCSAEGRARAHQPGRGPDRGAIGDPA